MRLVFVDTSGWMACADAADPSHHAAVAYRDRLLEDGRILVTTDYVADETLTLIRLRLGIVAAERWWQQVELSNRLRWELITPQRADKARQLFFKHRDKTFSFTDCTSFVLMQELKVTEAIATDKHFRQMRFSIVPEKPRRA